MIQSHLYTRLEETPVFDKPADGGQMLTMLGQGNWVGVIKRLGEWIRILSVRGEGWVKAEHVEDRPPFQLHVQWSEGDNISYVSSASGQCVKPSPKILKG